MFQRLEWRLGKSFVGEIVIKIRINFEYTKYVTYSTQVSYGEKSDFIAKTNASLRFYQIGCIA